MLTIVSLLSASPALAQDTAALPATTDCGLATLSQSVPADGATDVPIDLAPLLLFEGACDIPAPYTVSLFLTGGTVPLRTDVYDVPAFQTVGGTALLEPDLGALQADTAYTVELQDGFGGLQQIAFETGSGSVPTITGAAPGVTIDDARRTGFEQGFNEVRVGLTLTSAADDPSMSTYIVRSGGLQRSALLATGPTDSISIGWSVDAPLDEVCVSVVERDGSGTWHGPSDDVCADLASSSSSGCSTTGFPPSALRVLGGLLAFPLLRRHH